MSAISLVEYLGDGIRNWLFILDAVVDVDELGCNFKNLKNTEPYGFCFVGHLAAITTNSIRDPTSNRYEVGWVV